ncbi:hypothetical protein MMG85_11970 [Pseudoxanthomonas sp. LH2527]|uniref:hypothetical protein n=1 Tax=Pseudoxanthomonas sp. LH2527 TaxID=2923249 RepID=UPI001F1333A2|nr:hypothetical protein [Pseudoxanthomonas sp. LH2527]MCH6484275.1 hypothetical protein [Pseudoxanthomonas sp. LH2527]
MILPPRSRQKQAESDAIAADVARFLKKKGNAIEVLGNSPIREGKSMKAIERAKLLLIKRQNRERRRRRLSDEEE